jgi:hypothetical protein
MHATTFNYSPPISDLPQPLTASRHRRPRVGVTGNTPQAVRACLAHHGLAKYV